MIVVGVGIAIQGCPLRVHSLVFKSKVPVSPCIAANDTIPVGPVAPVIDISPMSSGQSQFCAGVKPGPFDANVRIAHVSSGVATKNFSAEPFAPIIAPTRHTLVLYR